MIAVPRLVLANCKLANAIRAAASATSDQSVADADPVGTIIYSATRRSCLPSLRPSKSRRSVAGAFSRACCTSTLFLIFPGCTHGCSGPGCPAAAEILEPADLPRLNEARVTIFFARSLVSAALSIYM